MPLEHSEGFGGHRIEGSSCTRAGRRRDCHDLDSAGPGCASCWQQVCVAGDEQMDFSPVPHRLRGLQHHLDSKIHIGLLLGLKPDAGTAASALARFLLVCSVSGLDTGAMLLQRLEVDVLATGTPLSATGLVQYTTRATSKDAPSGPSASAASESAMASTSSKRYFNSAASRSPWHRFKPSTAKRGFIMFVDGKPNFADLAAALRSYSGFNGRWDVSVGSVLNACAPANKELTVAAAVTVPGDDTTAGKVRDGNTMMAIEATFSGRVAMVRDSALLADVFAAAVTRVPTAALADIGLGGETDITGPLRHRSAISRI